MPEYDNTTPYAIHAVPAWSCARESVLAVVVKAAFSFDAAGTLTLDQQPPELELTDRHRGDPRRTSLAAATDCVPQKQGGEVLLSAAAQPGDRELTVMQVDFSVHSPRQGLTRRARLGITGPRRYERHLLGLSVTPAEPLAPLPLIAEYAYGGTHPDNPGDVYPANPVGCGYWRRARHADGQPLPQIQWHGEWVTALHQRPVPALVGPVASHWAPRDTERGTHNEAAARSTGCPIGEDATPAYYNTAPRSQRFPEPFVGGEIIRLTNLVEGQPFNSPLELTLPALSPEATLILGRSHISLDLVCDTLCVDADQRQVYVLYHAMVPWRLTERRESYIVLRDPGLGSAANPPLQAQA